MKIEKSFKACAEGTASTQQVYYLLKQTQITPKSEQNQIGLERQKYLAKKLITLPMTVKRSVNCSLWLEYICLYYRNKPSRLLPQWLEVFRARLFSEKLLPLEVLTFDALIKERWTVEDVVISSMHLSSENINGYSFSENAVSHWISLRRSGQPFFLSLLFAGDMVGQWALTLLNEMEFNLLMRGELNEENIKGQKYRGKGNYYGYISTVSVSPKFRGQRATGLLLQSVSNLLVTNKALGVTFSGLAANAYTHAGEKLCSAFGMNFVVDDVEFGKIYCADENTLYSSKLVGKGSFDNDYRFVY